VSDSIRSASEDESATESLARRVTFYEDRAEVLRTVTVRVSAGRSEPWIAGLSALVDDGSLRVRVITGTATVVAAAVARRARHEAVLSPDTLAKLEGERDEALTEHQRISREITRLEAERSRVDGLASRWNEALARVPLALAEPSVTESWIGSYRAVRARSEALSHELDRARRALSDADRIVRRTARALELGRREEPVIRGFARVQLDAQQAGEIALELRYRVPCALWRPEHAARLARDGESSRGRVAWTTAAVLWQRTGERWTDVEVRFSTARPARAASAPLLREDTLAWRRKTDAERQRVVVDAREQAVAIAGLDRGAREVGEMPGVDDGGEPVMLAADAPVTIASNGQPVRVELSTVELDATVDRVLYPERGVAPHLRATMAWRGASPLLAGPVRVAREGSTVGRGRAGFVGQGEPFELGFGTDDGVRARRRVDETRETGALLGAQKVKRVVRVFLSNSGSQARAVRLLERIPVSELAEVEVQLGLHEGWSHRASDGMLERVVELGPREAREVRFEYELRASSKVELPF
jgi:uncharacterized protein (TIGR02231 family)